MLAVSSVEVSAAVSVTARRGGGGRRGVGNSRGGRGGRGGGRGGLKTRTRPRRARHPSTSEAMNTEVRLVPPPDGTPVPKLIVFDLDDTAWFPELYMMAGAPWQRDELGRVTDLSGEELRIYPAAREAIVMISTHEAFAECKIAFASRTNRAQWAFTAMELHVCRSNYKYGTDKNDSTVKSNNKTLREHAGDLTEIYTGSKKKHFENLKVKTKIQYHDMLFFDNERVNITEVGQLGVVSVYCPGGMSQGAWEEGLCTFAKNRAK